MVSRMSWYWTIRAAFFSLLFLLLRHLLHLDAVVFIPALRLSRVACSHYQWMLQGRRPSLARRGRRLSGAMLLELPTWLLSKGQLHRASLIQASQARCSPSPPRQSVLISFPREWFGNNIIDLSLSFYNSEIQCWIPILIYKLSHFILSRLANLLCSAYNFIKALTLAFFLPIINWVSLVSVSIFF